MSALYYAETPSLLRQEQFSGGCSPPPPPKDVVNPHRQIHFRASVSKNVLIPLLNHDDDDESEEEDNLMKIGRRHPQPKLTMRRTSPETVLHNLHGNQAGDLPFLTTDFDTLDTRPELNFNEDATRLTTSTTTATSRCTPPLPSCKLSFRPSR